MSLILTLRYIAILSLLVYSPFLQAELKQSSVQLVEQLYREFAWEAVFNQPQSQQHQLLNQPRSVLERFFDTNLTELIQRDRRCMAKTQEICKLDFSPMWASQDPSATDLTISAGTTSEVVNVNFLYPSNGSRQELIYRMVKTKRGWRIADILYSGHMSLVVVLSSKE